MDNNTNYFRRTYVCWPEKLGGFSATWPFGKISISPDHIEIGSVFFKVYKLKKSDIINIDLVKEVSEKLFHVKFWGNRESLCKITPVNENFPKWLAFSFIDKDIEKLKEYGFAFKQSISS